MRSLTPEEISDSLSIPLAEVNGAIKQVYDKKMAEFSQVDAEEFAMRAIDSYEAQVREGWKMYQSATSTKERGTALEKIRQAQSSMDQLLKSTGVYVERSELVVSVVDIVKTQEFRDLMAVFLDFLGFKGIPPGEWFNYYEQRTKNAFGISSVQSKPPVGPTINVDPATVTETKGEEPEDR